MLLRKTTDNNLTLPNEILQDFESEYFEVIIKSHQIIIEPINKADQIREKLALLNITQEDISEAIQWVRNHQHESCA
jgi:hypothetical protein